MDEKHLSAVSQILGYTFRDPVLLIQALTHGGQNEKNYQRLEYLGDRVLNLAIAHSMFTGLTEAEVGTLSKNVDKLVCNKNLGRVARALHLDRYFITHFARQDITDYMLACLFESLVAALFIDSGYDMVIVQRILERHLLQRTSDSDTPSFQFEAPGASHIVRHSISGEIFCQQKLSGRERLKQLVRQKFQSYPKYVVARKYRHSGHKSVVVEVQVNAIALGKGQGKNMTIAAQDAAETILYNTKDLTVNLPLGLVL